MLLNGAITFLQKSLQAQQAKRFEEGYDHLTRATAILRGLSHHLDSTHGGAVADELYKAYNLLILACLRSYGRPQAPENFGASSRALWKLRRGLGVRRRGRRQERQGADGEGGFQRIARQALSGCEGGESSRASFCGAARGQNS